MFEAENYAPRIDAIAHTTLLNLPSNERQRDVASFNKQRLAQLRTAMTAWIAGRSLDDATFGERFFGGMASKAAIEKLRAAAEAVRTATSHQDLANASGDRHSNIRYE